MCVFAIEISRIVKKVTGLDVALNVEQFGAANGIYWVIRGIESLDEFQKEVAVLLADPEYLAKVNESVAGQTLSPDLSRICFSSRSTSNWQDRHRPIRPLELTGKQNGRRRPMASSLNGATYDGSSPRVTEVAGVNVTVTDNTEAHRFEVSLDGGLAHLTYRRQGRRLVLVHTEVPVALRGGGIGGQLVAAAAQAALDDDLTIVPVCSFARSWLR